jgi:hypothetical protein
VEAESYIVTVVTRSRSETFRPGSFNCGVIEEWTIALFMFSGHLKCCAINTQMNTDILIFIN